MPPLKAPFILRTRSLTSVQCRRSLLCMARCRNSVPRSDGMESKPQACTMRAPDARAVSSWASIIRRIHWTSPVMSQ